MAPDPPPTAEPTAKPLAYGRSHWDGKPAEIHAMILRAAGPLTLLVNELLGDIDSLDEATKLELWIEAFDTDWPGDLDLLPDVRLTVANSLGKVTSRSMYERLCKRFPGKAAVPESVAELDAVSITTMSLVSDELLLHIPMRQVWAELLDWQHPHWLCWMAMAHGHVELLRLLVAEHGVRLAEYGAGGNQVPMDLAAACGHVDILQMLHDAGNDRCTTDAMNDAAMRGHLHVVQWLHANTTAGCTTDAMDWAAGRGDLRMLEWLRANTTAGCTLDAVANAIDSSRLDAIRWLHQHYTHLFELYFVAEVAASGDLAVLQCLLECGCTATLDAIQEASDDKTLAVLLNSLTLVDAQELLQVAMDADSEQAVEQLTRVVSQLTVASADNE